MKEQRNIFKNLSNSFYVFALFNHATLSQSHAREIVPLEYYLSTFGEKTIIFLLYMRRPSQARPRCCAIPGITQAK